MSEKIYGFIHKRRNNVIGVCVTFIIATITNVINGSTFEDYKELLSYFMNIHDFTNFLMYVAICIIFLIIILEFTTKKIARKYRNSRILADYMKRYTSNIFTGMEKYGGFSWGEDRTIYVCDDMFEGWTPEQIVIDEYDSTPFEYDHRNEKDLILGYKDFIESTFHKQIERGNNNPRWMLTNYKPNFNKVTKRIFLSLQKTDWSQTSYSWNYFKNNQDIKSKKIHDVCSENGKLYPNSLCLHLIIETEDHKVLLSRISNNKRNDYPNTLAATIGEQIEDTDFKDGGNIRERFILNWVKRAMKEEFGFEEDCYENLLNERSIRILSINLEGDIYNFSIACVARLYLTKSELIDYMQKTPAKDKEIIDIIDLDINEIPKILLEYRPENKEEKYHPSTYLRLMLYYIHKKGSRMLINRFFMILFLLHF